MRRALTLVIALALVALPGIPGADAAGPPGSLQVKSVGTKYAGSHSDVAAVVAAGSAATFSVKVVNPGASPAEYRLRLAQSPAAVVTASTAGGLFGKPLVAGPDGYAITGVPALGSKIVTVKVTPPRSSPQQTFSTLVTLTNVDGTVLDDVTLLTEIKAPTKGTTAYTLLVSNGGSPAVGGDLSGQTVTGPSLVQWSQTKFTVKVRNDGPAATTILLRVFPLQGCTAYWDMVARDPSGRDVTLDIQYGVPVTLAKGGSKTFSIGINRANYPDFCQDMGADVSTRTNANPTVQKVWARIRVHSAVS